MRCCLFVLACSATLANASDVDTEHAVSTALEADEEVCESGDAECSLRLLQVKAVAAKEGQALDWQGVRETMTSCITENCAPVLGPAECYHLRCVCMEGYIYAKEAGGKCIHRNSGIGQAKISPTDTGDTCHLANCQGAFTSCINGKCLCRPGYVVAAGVQGCMPDPNYAGQAQPGYQAQPNYMPNYGQQQPGYQAQPNYGQQGYGGYNNGGYNGGNGGYNGGNGGYNDGYNGQPAFDQYGRPLN